MWGIRLNNSKPWFDEHKEEYKSCFAGPMNELAQEVYDAFSRRHPAFGLTVRTARIYKDARRPRPTGPYRDHLWFTLRRPTEEWTDKPAFWFELGPDGWTYGLGYYLARPETMAKHRARVDADPRRLEKLQRALNAQSEFVLEGERYKRPKGDPGPLLRDWYNTKSFSILHEEPLSPLIASPALKERLLDGFEFLAPFYEYFGPLDTDPAPAR